MQRTDEGQAVLDRRKKFWHPGIDSPIGVIEVKEHRLKGVDTGRTLDKEQLEWLPKLCFTRQPSLHRLLLGQETLGLFS